MQHETPEQIPAAECWDLLRTVSVGRLALSLHALPAILAVQFYIDGDDLAICLGHYKIPHNSVRGTVVAFAADAIDTANSTGWSVQVQGTTRLPTSIGVPTNCGQPTAGEIVHLAPTTVIGHRVRLCPFITPTAG